MVRFRVGTEIRENDDVARFYWLSRESKHAVQKRDMRQDTSEGTQLLAAPESAQGHIQVHWSVQSTWGVRNQPDQGCSGHGPGRKPVPALKGPLAPMW